MPAPAPSAATISVRQTLDLLDGDFASLADGVARGLYAFWLGSGISRNRVDDLRQVVLRVLVHLHSRIDHSNPDCAYRTALEQALVLAYLSPRDRDTIDFAMPVETWPVLDTVIINLARIYSRLLDIRVRGHIEPDYLLWEAVNVPAAFAAATASPDCEHICVAILALEGVLPAVASANWDGLIEAAVDELTDTASSVLRVCVVPDDFTEPPLLTRLLKFHGCAVRAASDPAKYRALLIARHSQITAWWNNTNYALMRHQLVDLAATRRTLMLGLSAQDVNIQDLFARAAGELRRWNWPCNPPAHVFAEDSLGEDQRNILRVVYQDAYDRNVMAIEASALFRAYAKPALTALVLHVLTTKLRAFIQTVESPNLSPAERTAVGEGIIALRNKVSCGAEPDRLIFIRNLVRRSSHAMALFQEGNPIAATDRRYRGLGDSPIQQIPTDANIATGGVRELATAIGILGLGESGGHWTVREADSGHPRAGALSLVSGTKETRIFFAANNRAGVNLEINGLVKQDDTDAIVIHSTSPVPRLARSPSAPLGRTGRAGLRNVGMVELLREATSAEHLAKRFREEVTL